MCHNMVTRDWKAGLKSASPPLRVPHSNVSGGQNGIVNCYSERKRDDEEELEFHPY